MRDVRTILERGLSGFDPGDGLDPTLKKARRRLRNRTIRAAALALVVTVAGTAVAARQFAAVDPPSPAASDVTPGVTLPEERIRRDAGIYSALVRVLAQPDDYPVYILDHTSSRAASPTGSEGETAPIPPEVQERVVLELRAYNIEFVSSREEVVIPEGEGHRRWWGSVPNGGVLLTFGPIPEGDRRVDIQANAWQAPKGAMWGSWKVELVDGGWRVTGEVGGISYS